MSTVARHHSSLSQRALGRLTLLAAALAMSSCANPDRAPTVPVAPPAAQILDGARQGNPHFYFLPPLVPQPVVTGTVDPNAGPSVVICEWNTAVAGGRCEKVVAQFARETNITDNGDVDVTGEVRFNGNHYHVKWDTQQCADGPCQLDPSKTYRIRVLAGSTELGHADVDIVPNQGAAKNVNTNEYIPLVDGKKLQLKFRIEMGAVAVVVPGAAAQVGSAGGEVSSFDGKVALTFPQGALASPTPITISPITEERPLVGPWSDPVELGPDGTTFAQPVILTLAYDVTKLPEGVLPEALKLSTWVNDHWEEVPGSTLNLDDATISAPITHFSGYGLFIFPNTVQNAPGPHQLFIGQTQTYGSSVWYWTTYPATYCYTYRVWVSRWFGGYWRYQTQCYTYTNTSYYPVSGYVSWMSSVPTVASVASPGYSVATNGSTTSPTVTALSPGATTISGRIGSVTSATMLTVVARPVINPFPQAPWQNVLPVVAGQTGTVQVPITNAGGGVLSDLAMGAVVVNCYNGVQYTWLTGTWSATTAPATLTLSATLPANTPAGDIDVCFPITATASGALPYAYGARVRVTPAFDEIRVQPNPAGVKPGQTVQLTGAALDASDQPVAGVPLAWSSSNTAIATVDANGLVTGVANGNVTITASSGGVTGSATVKVGTPSIAPSPGSLTIQVQQGQVNQAQIAINNGGTGLLTGLQAGSFSNYFNGSPAPWVTATFNTTTAPAILTITAAPGMAIGAGVHQLRFDVWGDGVPAYTFYSINITVVAAGVTPVNATIAPSPGSLAFSVEQGTSASRQIAINNSGTDPLTNLTAGSFSNYYNGSPAPWVTATFNTTTAPATLTITATPGLAIPAEEHHLRFEVMSPGATNSPYTFYSIRVTVTPSTQPVFSLTNLGTLGGTGWSEAVAINASGRIVGTSNNQGFYMDAAATSPTQVPNHLGDIWWARDVNASGVIAWSQPYQGFTWDPASNARLGPPPGPFAQNNRRTVYALNNTGMVLACADNGAFAQNYVWTIATNVATLIPGAGNFCDGRINDAGVAIANADPGAGGNSRLWNEVTQTATPIPSLGGVTIGRDLNSTSIAVGSSMVGGKKHAFRFDPATGQVRDLGTLGGLESEAMGINDAGFIVGWSLNAAGVRRGFIWDPALDRMFEIPPLPGYTESQARDINASGVIVGFSTLAGVNRATRWTPQ